MNFDIDKFLYIIISTIVVLIPVLAMMWFSLSLQLLIKTFDTDNDPYK